MGVRFVEKRARRGAGREAPFLARQSASCDRIAEGEITISDRKRARVAKEENPPESRDHRTGYGQTAYKRRLAYERLGIDPNAVQTALFLRIKPATYCPPYQSRPRRESAYPPPD